MINLSVREENCRLTKNTRLILALNSGLREALKMVEPVKVINFLNVVSSNHISRLFETSFLCLFSYLKSTL